MTTAIRDALRPDAAPNHLVMRRKPVFMAIDRVLLALLGIAACVFLASLVLPREVSRTPGGFALFFGILVINALGLRSIFWIARKQNPLEIHLEGESLRLVTPNGTITRAQAQVAIQNYTVVTVTRGAGAFARKMALWVSSDEAHALDTTSKKTLKVTGRRLEIQSVHYGAGAADKMDALATVYAHVDR